VRDQVSHPYKTTGKIIVYPLERWTSWGNKDSSCSAFELSCPH
jgi:hypothetical protein